LRIRHMGIDEVVIAFRSPWQNPYCEPTIGSMRRECLDHLIVLHEAHLRRILASYFEYYHRSRPHLSLGRNAPLPRQVEPPHRGRVIAIPQVGGLHHRYTRAA
jgi:putative transposase